MQSIKAKPSLHYTYVQVSSAEVSFSNLKPGVATIQTLRPAFIANLSGILQPKTSVLGLIGIQRMHLSSFRTLV